MPSDRPELFGESFQLRVLSVIDLLRSYSEKMKTQQPVTADSTEGAIQTGMESGLARIFLTQPIAQIFHTAFLVMGHEVLAHWRIAEGQRKKSQHDGSPLALQLALEHLFDVLDTDGDVDQIGNAVGNMWRIAIDLFGSQQLLHEWISGSGMLSWARNAAGLCAGCNKPMSSKPLFETPTHQCDSCDADDATFDLKTQKIAQDLLPEALNASAEKPDKEERARTGRIRLHTLAAELRKRRTAS